MFGFLSGLGFYIRGLGFILFRPGLWKYVILPWLISLLIFAGIFLAIAGMYNDVIAPEFAKLWGKLENINKILKSLIVLGVGGFFIIITLLLFWILGNLLTEPFNELLSCKVESIVRGELIESSSGFWKNIGKFIAGLLRAIVTFFKLLIVMFVLNLIPIIGQFLCLLLTSYYAAMPYLDYVLDRRGWEFRQKRAFMKQNRSSVIGFGFACFLGMVPPFTLITIPINVVGGTLFALNRVE